MGLAERKSKQKISADPRNLGWSQDTNRFSYQHLAKFGWDPTQGLGSMENQGNKDHIKVTRKLDTSGIGVARAMKEGADIGGAGEGLNTLFARLKKAGTAHVAEGEGEIKVVTGPMVFDTSRESTPTEEDPTPTIISPTPIPLINSSRGKYVRSKRLAASSPAAMAEILGIPISSLPSSPLPPSTPGGPGPSSLSLSSSSLAEQLKRKKQSEESAKAIEEANKVLVSPLSVGEYFRRKLAVRKALRAGEAPPDFGPDEKIGGGYSSVAKEFEGKKITFENNDRVDDKDEDGQGDEARGQAEVGVGGAGLGSAGDLNKVRSEMNTPTPIPSSPAEGKSKSKKEKRDKKGKGKEDLSPERPALSPEEEKAEKKRRKREKKEQEKKGRSTVETAAEMGSPVKEKNKKRKRDGEEKEEKEKTKKEKKSKKSKDS